MKEKEFFREVVADIFVATGKRELSVTDIKKYLKVGHNKAIAYMDGKDRITIFQFARQLL